MVKTGYYIVSIEPRIFSWWREKVNGKIMYVENETTSVRINPEGIPCDWAVEGFNLYLEHLTPLMGMQKCEGFFEKYD